MTTSEDMITVFIVESFETHCFFLTQSALLLPLLMHPLTPLNHHHHHHHHWAVAIYRRAQQRLVSQLMHMNGLMGQMVAFLGIDEVDVPVIAMFMKNPLKAFSPQVLSTIVPPDYR
jgi:hypothetical protein